MPFFGHMPHVPFGVRFPALAYSPFRWLHGSHRGLLIPPSRRALGATTQRPLSLAHATLSPQAATVYTSNRGIYFGPSTKYTNSPTDRVAESPDAHRRVVPRGGLRSELPDRVGCETLHLGVEDYCDKYSQVAHENRNSDFFSMRQAQVNELRYLIHTTLWYDNWKEEEEPPPGELLTTNYILHQRYLGTVGQHTLLRFLNTPLPPIIGGPLRKQEQFRNEEIRLLLALLDTAPMTLLSGTYHTLRIGDAIDVVRWLESCSRGDLRTLNIWSEGEEVIQRNAFTKFVRHLLGINPDEVYLDAAQQAEGSLSERVTLWRQHPTGEILQAESKKWGTAVLRVSVWKYQDQEEFSATSEEPDKKPCKVAVDRKRDKELL